ncbi:MULTISPECIES: hypothetical protein [Streptomyces]|uniref:Uncharacterized protein n=1 Tax=Streptomyces lonarensis TaxID=700599 RepID=A0A7X6CYG8_9ACTN|nr:MULTISPECIES: hypothetical protein [Streptomyces]NJQ04899.1 hypothetical protein [Streptomyces lonarensis]
MNNDEAESPPPPEPPAEESDLPTLAQLLARSAELAARIEEHLRKLGER